jgi:hypothetical protein
MTDVVDLASPASTLLGDREITRDHALTAVSASPAAVARAVS